MVRTLFDLANAELRHETRLFGYSFWMRKFAFSPQATIGLQLTKYESPNHLKLKLIDGKRMIDVIEFYSTADPKRAGRFAREIASKIDLEFAE